MEWRYIEGTNKRYKIFENGEIYSLYRYHSSGKKIYQEKKVKCTHKKEKVIIRNGCEVKCREELSVFLVYEKDGIKKDTNRSLLKVLCESFQLFPYNLEDNWVPDVKDGNIFNTNINNIFIRKKIGSSSSLNFKCELFLDNNGKIIEKTCIKCGIKKNNSLFKKCHSIITNICITCSNKIHREYINNNKEYFLNKRKEYCHGKGKDIVRNADIKSRKKRIETISTSYISHQNKCKIEDLTPELIELNKKSIICHRLLKQKQQQISEKLPQKQETDALINSLKTMIT